jgi:hypothetical protein
VVGKVPLTAARQSYNKNSITSGTTVTLTLAGTPSNNDFLVVGVALRGEEKPITVTGLGATWVSRLDIDQAQGQCGVNVFYTLAASYTGTQVVVTIGDGGTNLPVYAGVARYSGVDTTAPINATGSYEGPASVDDNDLRAAIATTVDNCMLVAFSIHRGTATFTVPGDQTSISVNDSVGTGGNIVNLSAWEQEATVAGGYIMGGLNSLSSDVDYAVGVLALTPTGSGVSTAVTTRPVTLRDRKFGMTLREQ